MKLLVRERRGQERNKTETAFFSLMIILAGCPMEQNLNILF